MVLGHDTKNEDIERISESATVLPLDPFHFRDALKSGKQLQEMRKRKNGKKVEKYHAMQNKVRLEIASVLRYSDNLY